MSSELRINASRANGAKSHGPVTPEGKLASSRNSLRHGILSKNIVLEGESSEAFLALLTSYQEEHQPETPTEEALIENMAVARWRQQRLWSMEAAGLSNDIRHPRFPDGDDFPTQAFVAFRTLTDDTRALELLNRYEARFDRQFRTSLACFRSLRAERRAPNPSVKPDAPVNHKLFWVGNSVARLAADPSAPPAALGSPVCRPTPAHKPQGPSPAEPRKTESEQAQPERAQPEKAEPERAQPEKAESERAQPEKAEPEKRHAVLGSFGNSALTIESPAPEPPSEPVISINQWPGAPSKPIESCADRGVHNGANDSMEIDGERAARPVNALKYNENPRNSTVA